MSKLKTIATYGAVGVAIFLAARTIGWYVQRSPIVQLQQQIRSEVEQWSGYCHYDFQILNPGAPNERIADVDEPGLARHWLSDRFGNDWFHDLRYVTFAQFDGVPEDGGQAAPRAEITDDIVLPLLDRGTIEWWALSGTAISDRTVEELVKRTSPRRLWLGQTQISDASLEILSSCETLEYLAIESTPTTDIGLKALAARDSLMSLSLGSPFYTAKGLRSLESLSKLEELYVDRLPISAAMASLGRLERLRVLSMRGTGVSDSNLAELAGLRKLERVHLDGTLVGDAGLRVAEQWPTLQTLTLQGTLVSDKGLEHLSNCEQLKQLRIGETSCSLTGVLELLQKQQGRSLENALAVVFDTKFSDSGDLVSLDLGEVVVRDSDLELLSDLHSLRWLYMPKNELTNQGLGKLGRLGLQELELLNVNGANIDDKGLKDLLTLPSLRNLHVVGTGVTEAGVSSVQKKRPGVMIYRRSLR